MDHERDSRSVSVGDGAVRDGDDAMVLLTSHHLTGLGQGRPARRRTLSIVFGGSKQAWKEKEPKVSRVVFGGG